MKIGKAPQRLVNEVQLFRIRVAAAESRVKAMREEAREAKRRRKEAKRLAQVARKKFKQSKSDLAELQEALAKAEAKLFLAGGRALARRTNRARRTARKLPRAVRKPGPVRARRRAAVSGSPATTRPAENSSKPVVTGQAA